MNKTNVGKEKYLYMSIIISPEAEKKKRKVQNISSPRLNFLINSILIFFSTTIFQQLKKIER